MTDDDKRAMLTLLTDEDDYPTLSAYLALAASVVRQRAFPFGDGAEVIPAAYDGVQVEIAAFMLNKRGAEGETSHSENGVSRSYDNGDIPPALLRRITPMAEVL